MKKKVILIVLGVVMLLVAFVVVAGFLGIRSINSYEPYQPGVETNPEEPQKLVLMDFGQLRGTNYFVSQINTAYTARDSYGSYSSPSRLFEFNTSGGQIRNLVFLDSVTLKSHKLFETNEPLILQMTSYPEQPVKINIDDPEPEIVPIQWFVYVVVHEDTNHDGILNQDDLRVIGISDVDGNRYKELISDVSAIYDMSILPDKTLLVVYRQKGNRFASRINFVEQSLTTEMLPDLGGDVQ